MSDIPESTVLPCGCRLDCDVIDGVNTLIVSACSEDCSYLQYMIKESQAQGKETTVIGGSG